MLHPCQFSQGGLAGPSSFLPLPSESPNKQLEHLLTATDACADLTSAVNLIERSVEQKEPRFVTRALRQTFADRKKITPTILRNFALTFPKQLEVGSVLMQALRSVSPSGPSLWKPEQQLYGTGSIPFLV